MVKKPTSPIAGVITEIKKITEVANPPALSLKSELYIGALDFTVAENEVVFVASGTEMANNSVSIDGYGRIDGLLTVRNNINIAGSLVINGTLEVGDRW